MLPPVLVEEPTGSAARRNRRDFERRLAALETRLGRHDEGVGWAGADGVVDFGLSLAPFTQAHNYLTRPAIRAEVLTEVLKQVPDEGRILMVGHSLGSVIAADLLRRLQPAVEISGLVTLGSPLGHGRFDVDGLHATLAQPPTNLAWWVNFWNDLDPVTSHRGLSSAVPWLLDRRIQTPVVSDPHGSVGYLGAPSVAEAIGFGLYGALDRSVAPPARGVDIGPDPAETVALMTLRYAHLCGIRLEGGRRRRHREALRQVQSSAVATSAAPLPDAPRHLTKDDAVAPLVFLATNNVIRPFEIEVSRSVRAAAMSDLTADMGLGSPLGTDVFEALDRAHEAVTGNGPGLLRWAGLGLGTAALVAVTGGRLLTSTPVVADMTVMTGGLVGLSPGPLLGALLSTGTLATVAGGSLALDLLGPESPAETVITIVVAEVATALLRRWHDLEQNPATWTGLAALEVELRRQHSRLAAVSDASSPLVEAAAEKVAAVDRALDHLQEAGLAPGSPDVRDRRDRQE